MLDTTKINHLTVERFHDDEIGKKKITVNEYEIKYRQERQSQLQLYMMEIKVKFQESNCRHIVDSKCQLNVWQKTKKNSKKKVQNCYVNYRGQTKKLLC